MPRQKLPPIPDPTVHNLRKRAEQMDVIARTTGDASARMNLMRKAETLRKQAEEIERAKSLPSEVGS